MLASTTYSIPLQTVPARAQVVAVFATARNPYTGKNARVLVLAVRTVRDVTPEYFKVADVREFGACCGFSVRVETLSKISVFVVQEM
jgi:hypothetical protein